jgi:hypothetical protein
MALLRGKTEDERAQQAAVKDQQQRERAARKRSEGIEKARQAFFRTPAGSARLAFEAGDQVFQYAHDVMSQQAIVVAMTGASTKKRTADPSVILNTVCNEGWELVTGSFVFVQQGQESRDKFMASGQQVAIRGATVGYYLFKRCEANKRPTSNPWEDDDVIAEHEAE